MRAAGRRAAVGPPDSRQPADRLPPHERALRGADPGDGLLLPLRPTPTGVPHRLQPGRRQAGRQPLRPAGIGGAPGEPGGHRQARRPAVALAAPRPPADANRRLAGAAVVERHDVRVPDAAAAHALLHGHAARPVLPHRGDAPDGVRRRPRRPVGYLRIRLLLLRRSAQLPVPRLRRPRAWACGAAWPTTWSWRRTPRSWRCLWRPRPCSTTTSASRRWGWSGCTGCTRRSTSRRRACPSGSRSAGCDRTWPITTACRWSPWSTCCTDDVMVRRFHADPRMQTVELLLQEQLPTGRAGRRAAAAGRNGRTLPAHAGQPDALARTGPAAHAPRALPFERKLRRDDHQRRRRLLAVEAISR